MSALAGSLSGARVLDLFAGSGALGLEALSRGAAHVVFVERAKVSLDALRANVESLGAEDDVTIVKGNALSYVRGLKEHSYDVALADPPYERGLAAELISAYVDKPFASELWVEHRTSEQLGDVSFARQRRYGDTTLSTLVAP
jgi:16S rRNA (guanine966-N2)-methyltransferase